MDFRTPSSLLHELQGNVAAFPDNANRLRLDFNKQVLLEALRSIGVKQVTVTYSGCGDSGQIDDVEAQPEAAPLTPVQVELAKREANWDAISGKWLEALVLRPLDLPTALADFCDAAVEATGHEGYQNHDGGQGTLTIDVDEGVVTLEHTDFYTESDTTAHAL
jgi:hypothetical protein